jgi:formamidopyrimidine-DNA glycosylase
LKTKPRGFCEPSVLVLRQGERRDKRIVRVVLDALCLLEGVSRTGLTRALEGNRFVSSRRHGKHLFLGLERKGWLALHFGMTGTLVPLESGAEAPRYTRLRIDFGDGGGLAYTIFPVEQLPYPPAIDRQ